MTPLLILCRQCHVEFRKRNKHQIYCSSVCSKAYWKATRPNFRQETDVKISTSTVGAIAEIEVALLFLRRGWDVFRSISASAWFDLFIMHRVDRYKQYGLEVRSGTLNVNGTVSFPRSEKDLGKRFAVVVHGYEKIFFFNEELKEIKIEDF